MTREQRLEALLQRVVEAEFGFGDWPTEGELRAALGQQTEPAPPPCPICDANEVVELRTKHCLKCDADFAGADEMSANKAAALAARAKRIEPAPACRSDCDCTSLPIAQTAPRPTGLSKGWNLVRQCDGFVIGHSSEEPSQRHKEQALADGRIYVPFLVAQTAPQPEQSGLVEALEWYADCGKAGVKARVALAAYRAALTAKGGT